MKYRARCSWEGGGKAKEDVEAMGLVTILVGLVDQKYIYYTDETASELLFFLFVCFSCLFFGVFLVVVLWVALFFFFYHSCHFDFLAEAGF